MQAQPSIKAAVYFKNNRRTYLELEGVAWLNISDGFVDSLAPGHPESHSLLTICPGLCAALCLQGPTFGRRLVFFGAAEAVGEPTLLQLFSQYGDVTGLFLVRSALGLPSGCGYVTMANAEQAAAALAALQGSSECAEAGGKLGLLIVQGPHTEQAEQPRSPQQKQKSGAHTDDNRTVSAMALGCSVACCACSWRAQLCLVCSSILAHLHPITSTHSIPGHPKHSPCSRRRCPF